MYGRGGVAGSLRCQKPMQTRVWFSTVVSIKSLSTDILQSASPVSTAVIIATSTFASWPGW